MGHKHNRDDILHAALDATVDEGLSQLTFGRLARRLGISDRIIVYYFPTKLDLIAEVIATLGAQLQQALIVAFAEPARDYGELARAAWPILATPENDPIFAVFFEATGLAAAGREPYRTLVPQLVDAWIDWAAGLLDVPIQHRRAESEAAIALVEGLLLIRQLAGPDVAQRAAIRLGVQ